MSARILHIAYSGVGGSGEVAVQLARHADRRRFQPAVCFFGVEPVWGGFRQRLEAAGIEWAHIPVRNRPRSLWLLLRHCLQLRPDLVVAHGATAGLILPPLRLVRPHWRTVAVFHGPPRQAQTISGRLHWLPAVAAAHRMVCVAPHLARLMRDHLQCNPLIIPNGVEVGDARQESAEEELLMVATLSPSKDHQTLLEAAGALARRRNHFRLVIVGDGILRRALERRAQDLGLAGRVEFPGPLSPQETRRRMASAAAFVYATHGEGCPLAVLEAMASGLPIVASSVPGLAEILEDGRTARLVPPRDPVALADALSALLDRPEEAAQLGRVARHIALREYSLAKCVGAYEDLFDSLLPLPRKSPVAPPEPLGTETARRSATDILFVTTSGMAVRYLIRDKIEALVASGYRVRALCGHDAHAVGLAAEGLPLDTIRMSRFFRPLADARSLLSLVRYLRRERPRVVHTSTQKAGLLGPLAARVVGIPSIHTVAGLLFHDRAGFWRNLIYRAAERLTATWADYLLFQSREDLERIRELGWKAPDRLFYLGNGVNLERFDPDLYRLERKKIRAELGYDEEHFVVGIVARLLWTKGLGEFLSAAEKLRGFSALRFLVVGPAETNHSGAVPEAEMRRAEGWGNVRFLGERQDMERLYTAMDLFALPSYREGMPRSLMEASSMELPVIASDIRGCREVIEHGQTGWLVPLGDVEALVTRILECWRNPECAAQMGRAGRVRVQRLFDEKAVHQRLLHLYSRLLGQPSALPAPNLAFSGEPAVAALKSASPQSAIP